jgi:hypothetical protein
VQDIVAPETQEIDIVEISHVLVAYWNGNENNYCKKIHPKNSAVRQGKFHELIICFTVLHIGKHSVTLCDEFLIRVTCPTTGGSAFYLVGNTDDTDWTACPAFLRGICTDFFISGHPQHPRHPRSVFIGNTNCFLSAVIRVLLIHVLFFYQKSLHLILHILPSHLNFETQAIVGTLHSTPQA